MTLPSITSISLRALWTKQGFKGDSISFRRACTMLLGNQAPLAGFRLRVLEAKTAKLNLNEWLNQHPRIKKHIVWEDGAGKRLSYSAWSIADRNRLHEFFQMLWTEGHIHGIQLPNLQKSWVGTTGMKFFLTRAEAFDVYVAHVAHTLYLEILGLVPWSILNRASAELNELLASYRFHSPIEPNSPVPPHITPGKDFKELRNREWRASLLSDPSVGYRFVTGETSTASLNLLGGNEETTLANLSLWFRDNVTHGAGMENYPKQEILARTFLKDRLKPAMGDQTIDVRGGCHAAACLFTDLARSINLPLRHVWVEHHGVDEAGQPHLGLHAGLLYTSGTQNPRLLWHVDLIYASPQEQPICPVDAAGSPIHDAAQLLFDTYWRTPKQHQGWGFEYQLESDGTRWQAGEWPVGSGSVAWEYTNLYQLGAWELVGRYCDGWRTYPDNPQVCLAAYLQGKPIRAGDSLNSALLTLDVCWHHIETCVAAYGGIDHVTQRHDHWQTHRGYNVGR